MSTELNKLRFSDFSKLSEKMQQISEEYGSLSLNSVLTAFSSVGLGNPYIQNRRVKSISTSPAGYTKAEIEKMLEAPDYNELPLRQVEKSIEYSSYPLFHARSVYQNLLTYHNYTAPSLSNDHDSEKDAFWREWKLLEKLRTELDVKANAHMITGQALQEGKVFYYPRIGVDKSHNKINYAFMQQLPSDWTKIVGFNNKSKYTLAFNLMYFAQPGTDIRQFGDLFSGYVEEFNESLYPAPEWQNGKIVYASRSRINLAKTAGKVGVNAYEQNGAWFYWVNLPVDKVFTFEIDDVNRNVFSPFIGLLIDMLQLVSYEKVQLELVQNPLISVVLGEIPYFDDRATNKSDQLKLSDGMRRVFEALFYQMLAATNTGGIGFFAAPFENMKLQQLAEAPSAMDVSSRGYSYTLSKAGLAGIIPVDQDTRSGLATISLMIESQFPKQIYACFERMFRCIIENLNLKYDWQFHMFGDLASDKDALDDAKNGMTLGMLTSTLQWLSLHDLSIFDDLSISDALISADIMSKRIPLKSSYNASSDSDPTDKGGRPRTEGSPQSDGAEQDIDSYSEERIEVN